MIIIKRANRDYEGSYKVIPSLHQIYAGNIVFTKEVRLLHAEIKKRN